MERRMFMRRQNERLGAGQASAPATVAGGEWSGIWAGYVVFAGSAVLLLFLVLGIGFSNVNPLDTGSWKAMAGSAAIWSGIAVLIATFLGGWAAARASLASRFQGVMRGLAVWGMVTITSLLLAGSLASGAAQAATGAAQAAAPVAAALGNQASTQASLPNSDNAKGIGRQVAQGAATTGSAVAWGGFWLSVLTLLAAVAGGASGARSPGAPRRQDA